MSRRLLLVVVIALLAAIALMIGRSATVPVQPPAQSPMTGPPPALACHFSSRGDLKATLPTVNQQFL
jgi:hypothetical protein